MSTRHQIDVERRGIETVPEQERYGVPRRQFWVWSAANLSMLPVGYGLFVVGLGLSWWQAVIAILIGLVVSYPLVGIIAVAGMRGGAPTMKLSRAAFGHYGNKLPTLVTYLGLIGWEIISLALGALATRTILDRLSPGLGSGPVLAISFVVMAAGTMVLAVYGYHLIQWAQKWITLLVAVVTVGYLILVLPHLTFHIDGGEIGSLATLLGGITLTIAGTGLGWVGSGADYSRYLPSTSSPRAVVGWTALGGGATQGVLLLLGVLLSTGDPTLAGAVAKDPIGALASQLPTWFLLPYLASVILSIIGACVVDLYSSGVVLQALGVRLPRPVAAGIDGVLMIAGACYVVFAAPTFFAPFQAFLIMIGSVVAAWAAVFITDLLLHRGSGYDTVGLDSPAGSYGRWNWAGLTSMIVGAVIGLGLVTSADAHFSGVVGFLLPEDIKHSALGMANIGVVIAFVVAGALYLALSRTTARSSAELTTV